jgi:hypothetical protein
MNWCDSRQILNALSVRPGQLQSVKNAVPATKDIGAQVGVFYIKIFIDSTTRKCDPVTLTL